MKRIALDTNAVNKIADTPGLAEQIRDAAGRHSFTIIGNPMVQFELEQTRDSVRRTKLLTVWEALPRRDVPTRGGYYGVGLKYGQSLYGDGRETGLSLGEARTTNNLAGARDAIIATTAAGEADIIVTDDGDLEQRVKANAAKCEVWTFERFLLFIQDSLTQSGGGRL